MGKKLAHAREGHLRVGFEGTRIHEAGAFILLADDLQEASKGAQSVHVLWVFVNSLFKIPA